MHITTEVITPLRAAQLLGANTSNRNLRKRQVELLARAITNGDWVPNGDAIRVAKDGTLLDGQHRLHAIIEADKAAESVIISDLDNNVMLTVDTGTKRTMSDTLRIRGVTSGNNVAAMCVLKWRIENGLIFTTIKPSTSEGMRVFERHPEYETVANLHCHRYTQRWRGAPSAWALAVAECEAFDNEAATDFFDSIYTSSNLQPGTAPHSLHRWLGNHVHRPVSLMAGTIKAFNAYCSGDPLPQIQWRPVGKQAEQFPTVGA